MSLAKWWGTIPALLAAPPATLHDLQAMSEFRDRVIEAEDEARERAKYGLRADEDARRYKGRPGPRPGDTIEHGGKKGVEW
jgi:hypothetical protein